MINKHRLRDRLPVISAFICFFVILLTLAGCEKTPINGDLDGQWQVMEVTPAPQETVTEERLYYCFSLHVCQLTQYGDYFKAGKMDYSGNKITIDFPDVNTDDIHQTRLFRQYGITRNPVVFTVEHLDGNSLVMRDGDITVRLRKF